MDGCYVCLSGKLKKKNKKKLDHTFLPCSVGVASTRHVHPLQPPGWHSQRSGMPVGQTWKEFQVRRRTQL